MGGRTGHEHHACFSVRPPLAAGCAGFPAPHRYVSNNRRQASYPADICPVRFVLGSGTEAWTTAPADSGGAQLGLGTESGRACAARSLAVSETESVRGRRGTCVCE